MIRLSTPSRLHFGLLHLPCGDDPSGAGVRRFGGVGLMIESPGVRLTARPAEAWSAEGPLADRALASARRFAGTLAPADLAPQHLAVEQAAPDHYGLGTGTQLGLGVARALAEASGWKDPDVVDLARRVGRGLRSAIGVHGFAQGGFLVDAGQGRPATIAPLVARALVPEDWRVVLVLPPWKRGLYGAEEGQAFEELSRRTRTSQPTDRLCRLVLLGMLPALAEADCQEFGEAVYEYNLLVGECFAGVQGGPYTDPRIGELVSFIRRQGVPGAGQSSWGPAVFAVAASPDQADALARRIRERFGWGEDEVVVTRANNQGARLVQS